MQVWFVVEVAALFVSELYIIEEGDLDRMLNET